MIKGLTRSVIYDAEYVRTRHSGENVMNDRLISTFVPQRSLQIIPVFPNKSPCPVISGQSTFGFGGGRCVSLRQ